MIRARMSFSGFSKLGRQTSDRKAVPVEPWSGYENPSIETVAASLPDTGDGTFTGVTARFHAVYTSDPGSVNHKWSAATPSGHVELLISNPHAVREIIQMTEVAKGPNGRKNNGKYDTCEFYLDIYPAPSED